MYFRLVSLKNLLTNKKKHWTEQIHFNTQFRYHGFVREICIFWQLVRTRTQQICVFKRLIIVQQMNGHYKLNGSKSVMLDYMVKWNLNTLFTREFYLINSTVLCDMKITKLLTWNFSFIFHSDCQVSSQPIKSYSVYLNVIGKWISEVN